MISGLSATTLSSPLAYAQPAGTAAGAGAGAAAVTVEPLQGTMVGNGADNSGSWATFSVADIPYGQEFSSSDGAASAGGLVSSAAPIAMDQVIQLSRAEKAIGLMPAAQFFVEVPPTASNAPTALNAPNAQSMQTATLSTASGQMPTSTSTSTSTPILSPAQTSTASLAQSTLASMNRPIDLGAGAPLGSTEPIRRNPLQQAIDDIANSVRGRSERSRAVIGSTSNNGIKGYLGVGIAMTPDYLGSDEYEFLLTPLGHVEVADLLRFSHLEGIEIAPFASLPVVVALGANWRPGRFETAEPVGLAKIDGGFEVGAEIAVSIDEVELFLDAEKGFTGGNLGWEIETGLRSKFIKIQNSIDVAGQLSATWGDDTTMDTAFGVSNVEAALTGLSAYSADAGLRDVRLNLNALYFFNDRLGVFAGADALILVENAAASPIVTSTGSSIQLTSNLGLIYRF